MSKTILTEALSSAPSSAQSSVQQTQSMAMIADSLQEAQTACEQQQWSVLIVTCQTIIDHCNQHLLVTAAQASEAKALETVTENVGEGLAQHSIQDSIENSVPQTLQASSSQPSDHSSELKLSNLERVQIEMYDAKGDVLSQQGDLSSAQAAYRAALVLQPNLPWVIAKLGRIYERTEQWREAIALYQQAIEHQPQQPQFYLRLAQVLRRTNQGAAAIEAQYTALKLNPKLANATGHYAVGNGLLQLSKPSEAIACYLQALAFAPQEATYALAIADVWLAQQQWSTAEPYYRRAISLDKTLAKAHEGLGLCFNHLGQEEEAERCFLKAIALSPTTTLEAYLALSQSCKQRRELNLAAHYAMQALMIHPNASEPYVWLRYNFLRYEAVPGSEIMAEIVASCRQILAKNGGWVKINSLLGYALTKQGLGGEAIAHFQEASRRKSRIMKPQIADTLWQSALPSQPSFIILGGFKCATTSLYQYLTAHPQIVPALEKELDFFDREFEQGLDWYLSHFPALPENMGLMTGEATPNYLYCEAAPERIQKSLPTTKLIVVLRDPIERALSHYYFLPKNDRRPEAIESVLIRELQQLETAFAKSAEPWEVMGHCAYLGNGLYFYYLQRWLHYFPREQLLIVPMNALEHRPVETMGRVFDYLGLSNYPLPEYQRHKAREYPKISSALEEQLRAFFEPYNRQLNALGMDWDQ